MQTLVRVISLKDSPRRRAFCQPSPDTALDFSFIDASRGLIDGTVFEPRRCYRHTKRVLVPAEIGVYCSHIRAWRTLLAHPTATQMIVMEDDVYADWSFLSRMAALDWSRSGLDYVKFYGRYPAKFRSLRWHAPVRDRYLIQYQTPPYGLQAYLITRKAAQVFESQFSRRISRPIDVEMDRPWATGIPVTGLVPQCVLELSIPSSIENRVMNYRGSLRDDSVYFALRIIEHARGLRYRLLTPKAKLATDWPLQGS